MTTLFLSTTGGWGPFTSMSVMRWDTNDGLRKRLMNPGPAIAALCTASLGGRLARTVCATFGGGRL